MKFRVLKYEFLKTFLILVDLYSVLSNKLENTVKQTQ